jgi:restriction system protein
MALRHRAFVSMIPWWAYLVLAVVVYPSIKYLIPSIMLRNPQGVFSKAMATSTIPGFAPIITGILLCTAAILAFNTWRRGELFRSQDGIKSLRAISWREFEDLVSEVYKRKGYAVTETGGGGADGGVDLILKKGGEKLLVQCKQWRMEKVGVKVVRELYGVVAAEGASGGIVISSGTFTQEAQDFASGKPLELIDGPELVKVIAAMQKRPTPVRHDSKDNLCPQCGSAMVLRTAKKGDNPGQKFWGCSSFPKCRGTRPYNA